MAAGHAVAFARAVDARGPLLLDDALQGKVDGFAAQLAGEHEDDLGLAGGPDQGRVDDAEGLGHEGEPGAQVRDWVGGVLPTKKKVSGRREGGGASSRRDASRQGARRT